MNWRAHRKWARTRGIDEAVAQYVNRIIDCSEQNELPAEYCNDIENAAEAIATNRGAERGNSGLGLVIAADALGHDAGRRKTTRGNLAAACVLNHLQAKGEDYVQAWYLHHHLDYLYDRRSADADITDLIRRYKTDYPHAHSPSIEQFLLDKSAMLARELG